MGKHCVVTGLALASTATAWPLFGRKQPEKLPVDQYTQNLADQMTRSFLAMDNALNRAFKMPILEADVYHMPDGQAVMTPMRTSGRSFFDTMFEDFFPIEIIEPMVAKSIVNTQKDARYINVGEKKETTSSEHSDEDHQTVTKHESVQSILDQITGQKGFQKDTDTDVVGDDGIHKMHVHVSSFNSLPQPKPAEEEPSEAEDIPLAEIDSSVVEEEDAARHKYIDNIINKWSFLLHDELDPEKTPSQAETEEAVKAQEAKDPQSVIRLNNIIHEKEELEAKLAEIRKEEEALKIQVTQDKLKAAEDASPAMQAEIEEQEHAEEKVGLDNHVVFRPSKPSATKDKAAPLIKEQEPEEELQPEITEDKKEVEQEQTVSEPETDTVNTVDTTAKGPEEVSAKQEPQPESEHNDLVLEEKMKSEEAAAFEEALIAKKKLVAMKTKKHKGKHGKKNRLMKKRN